MQSKRGYEHGCHTHGPPATVPRRKARTPGGNAGGRPWTAADGQAEILLLFPQGDGLKTSSPKFVFNPRWGRNGGKVGTFTLGPGWTSACLDRSGQLADGWTGEFISRVASGWRCALVRGGATAKPRRLSWGVLACRSSRAPNADGAAGGAAPGRGSEKHSSSRAAARSPDPQTEKGRSHFPSHPEGLWPVDAPGIPRWGGGTPRQGALGGALEMQITILPGDANHNTPWRCKS